MNEIPVGIIVTHNDWGAALVEEVESTINGDCGFYAIAVNPTTPRLSRPEAIPLTTPVFWFVDAPGSSAEREVNRTKVPGDHVITGFSMPMLLSFAIKRRQLSVAALVEACRDALERGNVCV